MKHLQVKYLLFALIIYIFAASDFLANYGVEIYPLGFVFTLIFIGILAFAITKYHLFEIQVILTEIFVVVIGILLLVQIFMAQNTLWRFINSGIFVLFCIFGYLLIRGVFREIKRREEAEKLSKAKSEFIAIVSHQLRTPLSAMKGYLSMILDGSYGELPEKVKDKIRNIYHSNERLIKLANDILSVSKIEAGEMEMNWEREDLREIIKEVISELSIKAREKNLYLNFEEPKEFPKILLDREKIRQVILNLIDNSIKYTQEGGITVKLLNKENKLQIIISDTGEGLTEEEKEKIFKRFSRGTAGTKFWTEGSGLGLYIARKLVEVHKGRIWVESKGKGEGSNFYVELPMK
jgi:signal transduction histidine kinase